MRTQNEMSTAAEKESGLIAREAFETLNAGVLPGHTADSPSETNAVTVSAVNVIAKGVLDSLKAGGRLKGTVRANSKVEGVDAVWVVVQIPLLGERQLLVRDEKQLQIGQDVMIECVPALSGSKRYVFRTANGTLTTPAVKPGASEPSCH